MSRDDREISDDVIQLLTLELKGLRQDVKDGIHKLNEGREVRNASDEAIQSLASELRGLRKDIREGFRKSNELKLVRTWFELYNNIWTSITPDAVETMKIAMDEYIWKEYIGDYIRVEGHANFDLLARRVLVMTKVYAYLLAVSAFKNLFEGWIEDFEEGPTKWLQNLCHDSVFRMVHLRQQSYYTEFPAHVREVMLRESKKLESAVDPHFAKVSIQIRRTAEVFDVEGLYRAKFLGDPKLRRAVERFAETIEMLPVNPRRFAYMWVTYPYEIDDENNGSVLH